MKIHSPRQLLAAIPHMLGFHPEESLVFIAIEDDEVEIMMRTDFTDVFANSIQHDKTESSNGLQLVDAQAIETSIDREIVSKFERNAASLSDAQIVLVLYSSALVDRDFVREVEDALNQFPILDVLSVSPTHWRSLMCTDTSCCPEDGHALDFELEDINVAFVMQGSAPFESRTHLSNSLEAVELDDEQNKQRELAFAETNEIEVESASTEVLTKIVDTIKNPDLMSWQDVALVCHYLSDFHYRDAVLRTLLDDTSGRYLARGGLADILRRSPNKFVAPVATTLAGCAWLDGNGALARIAIDRALEADSEYSLARLLDRALSHGVPPRVWADSLAAVSMDECMQGAA